MTASITASAIGAAAKTTMEVLHSIRAYLKKEEDWESVSNADSITYRVIEKVEQVMSVTHELELKHFNKQLVT